MVDAPVSLSGNGSTTVKLREFVEALVEHAMELHAAKLDALERVSNERNERYTERATTAEKSITTALTAAEKAVTTALTSAEKLAAQASAASEKAIEKSEKAQTAYNERSNEFRAALDDAAKLLMSRTEALTEFSRMGQRLDELKNETVSLRSALADLAQTLRAERTKEIRTATDSIVPRLTVVEAFMIRSTGQVSGVGGTVSWILAGAGFLGTVLGIMYAVSTLGGQ